MSRIYLEIVKCLADLFSVNDLIWWHAVISYLLFNKLTETVDSLNLDIQKRLCSAGEVHSKVETHVM